MNRTMSFVPALLMIAGCSYSRPALVAPMTLGPKERPVAVAQGWASNSYFFGFNMDGEDTLSAAIADAKSRSGVKADSMANVFVDKQIFCFPACFFPIFSTVATSVYGTLISYDMPEITPTNRPKEKPKAKDNDSSLM